MLDRDPVLLTIIGLWFIVFGASVGSFLNVLVYRLPLRKSIVHPPSHCPRCGHLIRWFDNIPVVGWLKLQGKCRDCKLPISVRYPCIEGLCSIIFGSIFFLLDQTFSLPLELLIGLTILLSVLAAGLLAVCLILYDKQKGS